VRSQISREIEQAVRACRTAARPTAERDTAQPPAHIEAHLERLSEENARNRAALADGAARRRSPG
jgi:hypothetical protein